MHHAVAFEARRNRSKVRPDSFHSDRIRSSSRPGIRRRAAALLIAVAFGTALFACDDAAQRPHVVLISVDTLRADHLGAFGYERATSPTLDDLAGRSVRFANAIAQAGWTLPSHMSLMTSLRPSAHGASPTHGLAPEATTLAEALQRAGYRTAAFVSWVYLGEKFGFGQGFDDFHALFRKGRVHLGAGDGAPRAGRVVDTVGEWLAGGSADPVFLFVHLFDPHTDYAPPEDYARLFDPDYTGAVDGRYDSLRRHNRYRHVRPAGLPARDLQHVEALYDGEVRYVDDQLERLLAAVDRHLGLDRCLLLLVSDHGEEFMDHGSMEGHGWTLYEEIVHVPMLIKLPDEERAGSVVESPVALIDIAPTVLDWLALEIPSAFEGTSLRPLLLDESRMREPAWILSENDRFKVKRRSIRGPRYKLIVTEDTGANAAGVAVQPGAQLFDLREDPGERQNLYARDDPRSVALLALLERLSAGPASPPENPRADLSAEELEQLRSLGYLE
jgi:arylsulfatase A-like enzyme